MNARALNALAGVIAAAMRQDRTPMGIALAIESAGLLMTPEMAAELESVRVAPSSRFTALPTATALCACGHLGTEHHHPGFRCWAQVPRLKEPNGTLAPLRACDCPQFRTPVEDLHDSPLHHTYMTARLREDQGADDGR